MYIEIERKILAIPLILRISLFASLGLGVLQILALFIPVLAPKVGEVSLSNPFLAFVMGTGHIILAIGIFKKIKLTMFFIIFIPVFQYGVLFLETGIPLYEDLYPCLLSAAIWVVIFALYFSIFDGKRYFNQNNV